ncbi:MAG TPA: class I SAM-dependent methyltransferase [Thermoanaerobaculia bacterium]|nr:class I SAM-dependent methyltransferase [Thermoanaerobaculia bacterium]
MTETTSFGAPDAELKSAVRSHWEQETCGTRYSNASERKAWFDELAAARYEMEPYILPFADFAALAKGKDVLEIGVGSGADFLQWAKNARHATGVDLTERGIELTGERLSLNEVPDDRYLLRRADAENLPFNDATFDIVYSWGVLHHTPDTPSAFAQAFRVLKPGGTLKAMIYHVPSWTGVLLVARYGWLRGNFRLTQKQALFDHLESPGTKAYSLPEARAMLAKIGFSSIELGTELANGDLMTLKLGDKYQGRAFRIIQALYPTWLVRLLGRRFGLFMLITARKPER